MFICSAALSSVGPSQVIKELQEFYTDTYNKLKSKDEPQRETLKAIHYAVCRLCILRACAHGHLLPQTSASLFQSLLCLFLSPLSLLFSLQLDCCGVAGGLEQFILDICPKKDILTSITVKVNVKSKCPCPLALGKSHKGRSEICPLILGGQASKCFTNMSSTCNIPGWSPHFSTALAPSVSPRAAKQRPDQGNSKVLRAACNDLAAGTAQGCPMFCLPQHSRHQGQVCSESRTLAL